MALGYEAGNPFGNPNEFTRSTGEDEIDRFNQWLRSQPWWEAARRIGPEAVERQLAAQGVRIPDAFHVDDAGNLNQKSRLKRNLLIAGAIGGGALGGLGLAGLGPLGGLGGGAAAAPSAAGAAAPAAAATGGGVGLGPFAGMTGAASGAGGAAAAGGAGAAAAGAGGGFLGKLPGILGGIGKVASGIQQGRAAGRAQDQTAGILADRNALDFAKFNLQAPQVRQQTAARGDMMANVQDVVLPRPRGGAGVQGGTRPSLLSDSSRQLGRDISRQALLDQMAPPMKPRPMPEPGVLDDIAGGLGYAGLIGEGLGLFGGR